MSSLRFYPIHWFEDGNWRSIQVIGRLDNGRSVYIRVGFRPYFTVRYPDSYSPETIEEGHNYLISETPIYEIRPLSPALASGPPTTGQTFGRAEDTMRNIYRIYVLTRNDYTEAIEFYSRNSTGQILDKTQDIKSKFFAERQLNPESWQQVSDLRTLLFNVTSNNRYTSADLEYYTQNITSLPDTANHPEGINAFFDIEAIPSDNVSFPDAEADRPPDSIFAISLIITQPKRQFDGVLSPRTAPTSFYSPTQLPITQLSAPSQLPIVNQLQRPVSDQRNSPMPALFNTPRSAPMPALFNSPTQIPPNQRSAPAQLNPVQIVPGHTISSAPLSPLSNYSSLAPSPLSSPEPITSPIENIIFIVTDQPLPEKYTTNIARTIQPYDTRIVRVSSEKELLERFFDSLAEVRPDRLISMNGRHFDINYIGARSRALNVRLPPFTKILSYQPYFYPKTIFQSKPFPVTEQVWALSTPSISQVDLLDFYRRLYPQLGNHKLDTLAKLILGRGKTGLEVAEMFAKYRRGSVEDLLEIIDYSLVDSILLRDLWKTSQIEQHLANMANFWKNDPEHVITHDLEELFEDLIRYLTPDIPATKINVGKGLQTERLPGIHRNVYLYSLSDVYLSFIEQINTPLANAIADYFQNSNDGIIPFKSGYFNVSFGEIESFINNQLPTDSHYRNIWVEDNSLAVASDVILPSGPYMILQLSDFVPLILVSQKSWIMINATGMIFKKGMSAFVRPPFRLVERYINFLIEFLIQNPPRIDPVTGQTIAAPPVSFPQLPTSLEDFVLEIKVNATDFAAPNPRKEEIVRQLQQLGMPVTTSWRKVKYIKTVSGPVIEEIYSREPENYVQKIDLKYYNPTLQSIIRSVFV